jgi:MFS family permease
MEFTQANLKDSTRPAERRWLSVLVFSFVTVIDGAEGNLMGSLFPTIRDVMALSLSSLSLLSNINKIISAVLGPLWGIAADRYDRKKILVFVTGIWGFWTIAAGFSQTFSQLLLLTTIAAIGAVASMPIIMSAISDLFADNERGKAMGIFGAASFVLGAISTPLFGLFANVEVWRLGYFLVGGLSVVGGLLIWLVFEDPGRGASEVHIAGPARQTERQHRFRLAEVGRLLHIPTLALLFVQKFMNAGQAIWTFGTVYMVDVYGFTNSEAIILYVPLLVGSILSNVVSGFVGDWVNQRNPRRGRVWALQCGFLGSAVMSYLSTQIDWGSIAGFSIPFFFWGLFASFGTGIDRPMVAAIVPPSLRATGFSLLFNVGDALAAILTISLVGYLGDRFGLQVVFLWTVTAVMFVRVLFWFPFHWSYPRDVAAMHALLERES